MRLLRLLWPLFNLLLCDGALARSLSSTRIGARPLATNRQRPAMASASVAADLHQPFDVHRHFLAEIAFNAALLLEHPADFPDIVLRQVLHADVGTNAGLRKDHARTMPPDPVDVGETDFNALGARKIDS